MDSPAFDPLSADFLAHPYSKYAALRRAHPVFFSDRLGAWVLTRYADCARVLSDTDAFASDPTRFGRELPPSAVSLQTLDPPLHRELRHPFLAAMRLQDLDAWQAATEAVGTALLQAAADRPFDFINEFAEPLALRSMAHLFGVTDRIDEHKFRRVSRDIVLGMDAGLDPSRTEPCAKARITLNHMIESWFADTTVTGLVADLRRLGSSSAAPFDQLINTARVMFHAGYSSLSSFLGNAVGWLARRQLLHAATLQAADSRMTDELLRLDSSVQAVFRMCAEDLDIQQHRLRTGDGVIALVGAANHDPEIFPDPAVAHFTRSPNPHLSLGRGIHACLGGHLAGRVTTGVLRLLGSRCTRLELAAPPVQRASATLRGLDALPLHAVPGNPQLSATGSGERRTVIETP
ncbi:cytochrome P450 [Streptomyces eurythermus]|uniref:cytochrome P450 n=1 Tax=Streptomyces eurythermus TaxID=42237 RepID=UPI0033EECCC0